MSDFKFTKSAIELVDTLNANRISRIEISGNFYIMFSAIEDLNGNVYVGQDHYSIFKELPELRKKPYYELHVRFNIINPELPETWILDDIIDLKL